MITCLTECHLSRRRVLVNGSNRTYLDKDYLPKFVDYLKRIIQGSAFSIGDISMNAVSF